MKLQLVETKKLFYDRYLYRVSVINSLSHLFRHKNLDYAKTKLDELQTRLEQGNTLEFQNNLLKKTYSEDHFHNAKIIYQICKEYNDDYMIRVENPILNIYSNDENWMFKWLHEKVEVYEYSRPEDTISQEMLKENIILSKIETDYPYKVTLKEIGEGNMFGKWVSNNQDKIKIGKVCLEAIENNQYCSGLYFYVRDSKVLDLVNIALGGGIQRIDKIVCITNIDK